MTDFIKVLSGEEQPDVKVTKYATVHSSAEDPKKNNKGVWKWVNEDGSIDDVCNDKELASSNVNVNFSGKDKETKTFSDADVKHLIDKDETISIKEKETVKETIEKDGINNYTITVNNDTSGSELVRKLIDEIERLQKNR